MALDMDAVKDLRARTGAGVLDCKKALAECEGDIEKSVDFLREKGLAKAAKERSGVRLRREWFSAISTRTGKSGSWLS